MLFLCNPAVLWYARVCMCSNSWSSSVGLTRLVLSNKCGALSESSFFVGWFSEAMLCGLYCVTSSRLYLSADAICTDDEMVLCIIQKSARLKLTLNFSSCVFTCPHCHPLLKLLTDFWHVLHSFTLLYLHSCSLWSSASHWCSRFWTRSHHHILKTREGRKSWTW